MSRTTQPIRALPERWPEPGSGFGTAIQFPSRSPFTPAQAAEAQPVMGLGSYFLPEAASAGRPIPAVVLLQGSGGVLETRERAHARQLVGLGVAALIVDNFAARRDLGRGPPAADRTRDGHRDALELWARSSGLLAAF